MTVDSQRIDFGRLAMLRSQLDAIAAELGYAVVQFDVQEDLSDPAGNDVPVIDVRLLQDRPVNKPPTGLFTDMVVQ